MASEPGGANPRPRVTAEALAQRLDVIERAAPNYPRWLSVPVLGLACAAFCGAIEGTGWQMVAAFVGAAVGQIVRLWLLHRRSQMVSLVVGCAFASCLASYVAARGLGAGLLPFGVAGVDPGRSMLASVLYLVPGVPLVTSLLDIIHGDYEAGLARGALAALVVASLGVGVLLAFSLVGHG